MDGAAIQHNAPDTIRDILGEVLRVLKPGGRFFGTMVAEDSYGVSQSLRTHYFSREELAELFCSFCELSLGSVEYDAGEGTRRGATSDARPGRGDEHVVTGGCRY